MADILVQVAFCGLKNWKISQDTHDKWKNYWKFWRRQNVGYFGGKIGKWHRLFTNNDNEQRLDMKTRYFANLVKACRSNRP